MTRLIDASALGALLFPEHHTEAVSALLAFPMHRLATIEFARVEFAQIAWKKHRKGLATVEQAAQQVAALGHFVDEFLPTDRLVDKAFELSVRLSHPVYDCLYVVGADQIGASILTCDQRMAACCRRLGVYVELAVA